MGKLGIVLAGGGGKGAYQVGVWKYLHKRGMDRDIAVISGASVGSLNAVLLGLYGADVAADVWLHRIQPYILSAHSESQVEKMLYPRGGRGSVLDVFSSLLENGMFSSEGLQFLLESYVDERAIKECGYRIYATCTAVKDGLLSSENILLNRLSKDSIVKTLLASSALPGVFGTVNMNRQQYADGGILDNEPIYPLVEEGCTDAIIIRLSQRQRNRVHPAGMNITEICPSEALGNFITGALDFSSQGAERRISLGYRDAAAQLSQSPL